MFILDEGETHVGITARPEADPGTHRNLGPIEEIHRELHRSLLDVGIGNRGPDEHGPGRPLHLPAVAIETIDQDIPSLPVDLVDLFDIPVAFVESDDRGNLDRLEGPVVEIALELGQGSHHR